MKYQRNIIIFCALLSRVAAEPFALGADISWIQQREKCGVRYYHNNLRVDPFQVLKEHGFNWIRLRLFVDPLAEVPNESESPYATTNGAYCNGAGGPYCGLDSTIAMAKRAKNAGMKLLLDFHYSDTWADPAKQHKPVSWSSYTTASQVADKIREYTRESLEKFQAAGVLPDMIQVGNETVSAMAGIRVSNISDFAAAVNAGIDGARDVSPDIKILVHTINERNPVNWISNLVNAGVSRIDVLGLSYYSEWHGTPDSLQRVANAFAARSNLGGIKFCVVEYADNHRRVNDIVYGMSDNRGFGTFVWEPFDWRETLFDWKNTNPSGRHSNDRLKLYPVMAEEFGLTGNTDAAPGRQQARGKNIRWSSVAVKGRTLRVTSPDNSALAIRMIDARGKVRARFNANGGGSFALDRVPAGRYFVEVRGGGGDRRILPVIVCAAQDP